MTSSIYVMMITYGFVGGISTGCCYLASLIIIPDYFDKKRGIATGITMAGSGVGSFVFSPLIGGMITRYDWKFCMSICACVVFETCMFGAFLRPLNAIKNTRVVKTNKKQV
jgi:MFS family permease